MELTPWTLILLGFCSGTMAALFGVGGGIVATPFLHALGLPMPIAVACSAPMIAVNGAAASIINRKNRLLDARMGVLLALGMIPVAEACARFMSWASRENIGWVDAFLRIVFFVIVLGSLRIVTRHRDPDETEERTPWPIWKVVLTGTPAGLFAGLLGLGGGRILVPAQLMGGVPLKRAVSTSSFVILISSTYTAGSYISKKLVEFSVVQWVLIGAVAGSLIGAQVMHRMDPAKLKKLYLGLTYVALLSVVLKQFGLPQPAALLLLSGSMILVVMAYSRALFPNPTHP